jgi:TPR repeat protein
MALNTSFKLLFALLWVATIPLAWSQALPQNCSAESQKTVQNKAEAGDKKAQFVLGSHLIAGKCTAEGKKEPAMGMGHITKSAAQNYAPAMYLVGVSHLTRGIEQPGLAMLFGAAKQGFREAEIMLGVMFANEKFSKKDNLNAYGWLSLARQHSSAEKQQKVLDDKLAEVKARMTAAELAKAEETKAKFLKEMGDIPTFNDLP